MLLMRQCSRCKGTGPQYAGCCCLECAYLHGGLYAEVALLCQHEGLLEMGYEHASRTCAERALSQLAAFV